MRRAWRGGALAGTLLAAWAGLALAGGWASQEFHWSGTLARGRSLDVSGVNGTIAITQGSGDRVEVNAVKTGKKHDPAEVRIEVVPDAGGLHVCAIYPGGRACDRGGEQHIRDNDVQVDFKIVVPAGVSVEAKTVNGAIEVAELEGDVKAGTVNGNCTIATRGSGSASTVNGSVNARVGRLAAGDRLDFSAVNGAITVALPERADASVDASTVNGGISTEFPLTVQGRWGPKSLNGKLGSGAGRLRANTVNGSIRLVRGGTRTL